MLAEYCADKDNLFTSIRANQDYFIEYMTLGCNRINIWGNYRNVEPRGQNSYYSIQVINNTYVLCGLHLISDLHGDNSEERFAKIREIIKDVHDTEEEINSFKSIIVGDFNDMPYSKGLLNADGFHGLPALKTTKKKTRMVSGTLYREYYNPMWNFFGDFSAPPGTYYYNNSKLYSPMWYILDQFLLSRELAPNLVIDQLKIITECSHGTLYDKNDRPNTKISDHFPIMCEIDDTSKGNNNGKK
ncbi:endonuclease/exonuclease/phosphatase [Scardovia inopinata]|uniref:endonuclease/exonuclease/phosphatase n=1 Tax=Scardovia inopinata TaxID=78259 RepID=UPI001C612BF9|nr:endonuclease/exonuclease/phosphatase [Scardovia inopinata]